MGKECEKCKKEKFGSRQIFLKYRGIWLSGEAKNAECFSCARKKYLEFYKKAQKEGLVKIRKGKLVVDWKLFINSYRWPEKYGKVDGTTMYHYFVYLLLELNILSSEGDDNYEVIYSSGFVETLPNLGEKLRYFTRSSDADEYMEARAPNADYPWEIRKIKVVKQYKPKSPWAIDPEQL